jgi:hypothetical protein
MDDIVRRAILGVAGECFDSIRANENNAPRPGSVPAFNEGATAAYRKVLGMLKQVLDDPAEATRLLFVEGEPDPFTEAR